MRKVVYILIVVSVIALGLFFLAQSYGSSVPALTGNAVENGGTLSSLTLSVNIPCPGHAGLIKNALLNGGVSSVSYIPLRTFEVKYDPAQITPKDILDLRIFDEYPATIVN